jgi:hypothetical protein
VSTRYAVGVELCGALGLDPDQVNAITLRLEAGELAEANVVMFVDPDRTRLVLQRYRLTWAPPWAPPNPLSRVG